MTYTAHTNDCNIFKDSFTRNNGCDCIARFARAPIIMGPHEKDCPYLTQMPFVSKGGHFVPLPVHGICYCSAHPDHDDICTGMVCWRRRKGVFLIEFPNGNRAVVPCGELQPKSTPVRVEA